MEGSGQTVCVTGAGGFIASWLVKLLLERGYHVRGTVRDPGNDEKYGHLKELKGAEKGLTLVKADLLDSMSLASAIDDCDGVFHTACPVVGNLNLTNPEAEMLDPAIKGTLNVLEVCNKAQVKRVIVTSSIAAVAYDPKLPKDKPVDESCWTSVDYCREKKNWYGIAKTVAEQEAWKYAKEFGLDMVAVCPALVVGPMLQSTINGSSFLFMNLLNGSQDSYENKSFGFVHVKDVALAHILAYETPSASGRYMVFESVWKLKNIVEKLQKLYPQYTLTAKCAEVESFVGLQPGCLTKRVQELGLVYTPLEQTIRDTVENLQERGILK